jgi:hypothetical protein
MVFAGGYNTSYWNTGRKTGSAYMLRLRMSKPAVKSSSLSVSNITTNSMVLEWQKGDGANRIVIASEGTPSAATPTDGEIFKAAAMYKSGQALGNGFVVYSGNDDSVKVNGLKAATTYYFTVIEYNGYGQATMYQTNDVLTGNGTTLDCPAISNPSVKDTSRCGSGTVTIQLPAPGKGLNYFWYATEASQLTMASGLKYVTPALAKDTFFWVSTYDSASMCQSTRVKINVSIFSVPAKPTVNRAGDSLKTTSAGPYQWYRNGLSINGATQAYYNLTQTGKYKVRITNQNGCETFSDEINIATIGIEELQEDGLYVYPNPAAGTLYIRASQPGYLELYDLTSRRVLYGQITAQGAQGIDISALHPGTYILQVRFGEKVMREKVIIGR